MGTFLQQKRCAVRKTPATEGLQDCRFIKLYIANQYFCNRLNLVMIKSLVFDLY